MQKILFPTDFSKAAEHAFIYALHLSEKFGAILTTLHAYEPPRIQGVAMPNMVGEIYESIKMEEFEDYQRSVENLRKIAEMNNLGNVPMQHLLKTGPTVDVIVRASKSEKFDLLVMGTKGATGLKEVFVGSVAGEVMEQAFCPVLAVPDEAIFDMDINRIAITTEFTAEDEKMLRKVLSFADLFKAELRCLHVVTHNKEEAISKMETLREKYRAYANLHFELLENKDIFKGLNEYLTQEAIDIVAMLTHRRNFFQELFNYSKAKKMVYHTHIPVLAIESHTLT